MMVSLPRDGKDVRHVHAAAASSSSSGGSDGGFSVSAMNPDANALSVNYLYMALFILVVGIIMGKVIF